jgi:polyphosphate kinase
MYRNLDNRSEVAVPIYDVRLQEELKTYLNIQLHDNMKARVLNRTQNNKYVIRVNGHAIRAQESIYRWLTGKWNPDKLPATTERPQNTAV